MTFRDTINNIVSQLKANAGDLGCDADAIERGKPGMMPQSAPFILVFAAPANEKSVGQDAISGAAAMRVDIFTGAPPQEDPYEAILVANEMAEACVKALAFKLRGKIANYEFAFDTIYSDYAVAIATIYINYEPNI